MTKTAIVCLLFAGLQVPPQASLAQGLFEMGKLNMMSAGAGAGTAAALTKNKPALPKGLILSTDQLNQLEKNGAGLEKKKDFAAAESCYRRCLSSITRGAGAESAQGQRILEHLSAVCAAQSKYGDAVGFYGNVVANKQKSLGEAHPQTLLAKHHLADMFAANHDYQKAATHLAQVVEAADKSPTPLPNKQFIEVLDSYSMALREIGREDDARQIDARANALSEQKPDSAATQSESSGSGAKSDSR